MSWPQVVVIAYLALGTLLTVAKVGKPQEPVSPATAVLTVLIAAGLIWLVTIA